MNMQLKKIKMSTLSVSLTALMFSGVSQASDLQIYATPTAGQKTVVLMVDVSGSMTSGTGVLGVNRLQAVKNGLLAVLDSKDSKLNNIVLGLGVYPRVSNIDAGKILVPAEKLGNPAGINTPESAQRQRLRAIVINLTTATGTPTSHAYAEAASYLMGTRPYGEVTTTYYQKYRRYNSSYNECNNYSSSFKTLEYDSDVKYYYECSLWKTSNVGLPSTSSYAFKLGSNNNERYYTVKSTTENIKIDTTYSGFDSAVSDAIKNTSGVSHYKSPLPTNKVTCDGQGIYVLSDGEPNGTSNTAAQTQMRHVLTNPLANTPSSFSCANSTTLTNPLTGGDSGGNWQCMGEFAKALYSGENPAGVKIQTAFVGFGSSFNNLNSTSSNAQDIKNACKLGSRLKGDSCSYYQLDGINQNTNATLKNPLTGYGNGGFYTGNNAADVTQSVLNFIDNLGTDPLEPLPTGSISIPVDALNPNGLQNVGYLRMLEPNPAQPSLLTWVGNLKKYSMTNGVLVDGTTNIFNATGGFIAATKNMWGARTQNDGGKINIGGAYEMMPVPISTNTTKLRNVFTDASSATSNSITSLVTIKSDGQYDASKPLLKIGDLATGTVISKDSILNAFRAQSILKDFPLNIRLKLLNYMGFKVDAALEEFPANDDVAYEGSPYFSMGGIIHSFPVQMTYSGTVTESGELATTDIVLPDNTILKPRQQSVLYGSMEGGLHIVDASTGIEQMAFIPAELLNNTNTSSALVKSGSGTPAPAHGVDSPWVLDATYRTVGTYPNSQIKATKMDVLGGLRMGGASYYGLDVLDPTAPKLKFRIGADQTDFARMGQSWSKPILINIRYNGVPTRAFVVGGGYDACYEEPRFTLSSSATVNDSTSCTAKTRAKGNAVYVVDAETGKRLFWASNTGSNADNANLRHSIVSRISTLDRDGDGYIDHLYFGDLGGQIFRVDLDNFQKKTTTTLATGSTVSYSAFGVRTIRLANLATTSTGAAIAAGDQPRFYEPVTLTIHDEVSNTFILVGAASGDRSTPLDVAPIDGREGLSPAVALTGRPTNKVFGIFDLDFQKQDLITNLNLTGNYDSTTAINSVPLKNRLITRDITLKDLLADPQTTLTGNETIYSKFFNGTASKFGWYRSLSWSWDTNVTGLELSGSGTAAFRKPGGLKAFEEPIAIGNNLFVSVYDPEGTGVTPQNPCLPRVIGETDRQQYCLPFGICVNDSGAIDTTREKKTGFKVEKLPDGTYKNTNVIGKGIQGLALANNGGEGGGSNNCGNFTLATNTEGLGNWQCTRKLNPTRWFEKR
ncbi:PilC/PilY family type IV pilus protein [Acinetobacter terrestris]|uniref:PilC/PilY family type IV pilus protein n=1 Tax=Acinetobacter terrestris TaxID=2529843 RepID=UPI0036112506